MTTIMNQVTCSLCDIKTDEFKWNEHLVSTKHLKRCKEEKSIIITKFFEISFNTYHERKATYNLKDEKTLDVWQPYFETQLPKEKFKILCKDSNNSSVLEASLTSDLLCFMNDCGYDIESSCFDPLDKIIFCRVCNDEVYKSLFYNHIKSEKHRDIEKYFISKCMTYCERCDMEIKNDNWRQHLISSWHLAWGGENIVMFVKRNIQVNVNTNI